MCRGDSPLIRFKTVEPKSMKIFSHYLPVCEYVRDFPRRYAAGLVHWKVTVGRRQVLQGFYMEAPVYPLFGPVENYPSSPILCRVCCSSRLFEVRIFSGLNLSLT